MCQYIKFKNVKLFPLLEQNLCLRRIFFDIVVKEGGGDGQNNFDTIFDPTRTKKGIKSQGLKFLISLCVAEK